MRLLAKSAPSRVKVFSIGTTEEGREMIAVAVASEEIIARIDENKARLAKLADPRTIGMDDGQAARIVPETIPVYYITGTIHSPEAGAPTALMEMAYRLVVDDSAYIRNIRDNVLTLITPIVGSGWPRSDGRYCTTGRRSIRSVKSPRFCIGENTSPTTTIATRSA